MELFGILVAILACISRGSALSHDSIEGESTLALDQACVPGVFLFCIDDDRD